MKWKHLFSVAPMMEYTDVHQRYLMRSISKKAVLYTEMVTANTLCRAEQVDRFLAADFIVEEPVVLQLGGSDVTQMTTAAKIAAKYGYKEINLNVGCPSEKVAGKGCFGAALMLEPQLVSDLCLSISESTGLPSTVKCRIGVNDNDSYEELCEFIGHVSSKAKVDHFIVHARKAILDKNFSPDDNRKIPPLKYNFVYNLLKDFPHLTFTINGGINSYGDVQQHLERGVHGAMVGRAVVNDPFYWRRIDQDMYGVDGPVLSRQEIVEVYATYARDVEAREGLRARSALMKPILGMFAGKPNGKKFRRSIDEGMREKAKPVADVLLKAMMESLDDSVLSEL